MAIEDMAATDHTNRCPVSKPREAVGVLALAFAMNQGTAKSLVSESFVAIKQPSAGGENLQVPFQNPPRLRVVVIILM